MMDDFSSDAVRSALGMGASSTATPSSMPAPMRNNNPGALMPGGKLAQYGSPEEGLAALDGNLKSYGTKGINTLSGVISRWAPPNENNTAAYLADASKATGLDPGAQIDLSNPYVRHQISAAIVRHENGTKAIYGAPTAQAPTQAPAQAPAQDPMADFSSSAVNRAIANTPTSATPSPASASFPTPAQTTQGMNDAVSGLTGGAMHMATAVGSSIIGGWKGLAALAGGGSLDEAAQAVTQYQQDHTYQGTPGEASGRVVEALGSNANPLNWPAMGADWAGGKVTDLTGSPAAGAAVNTAIQAIPLALGLKGGGKVLGGAPASTSAAALVKAPVAAVESAPAAAARFSNVGTPAEPVAQSASAQLAAQFERAKAGTTAGPVQTPATAPQAPRFANPEDLAPAPSGALPKPIQDQRAQVLTRIGLNDARASAVAGDGNAAATDLNSSRLDTPAGNVMKSQIATERTALENHAASIIEGTGGTTGTDGSALYARGNTIVAPLDSLKGWFDTNIKSLYDQARERSQGSAVELSGVNDVLAQKSGFTGNTDTLQLRAGVTDRMQELGMLDKEGNTLPATVDQAENLRKYLNEQWTPKNSTAIGRLKDAIDTDVMSQAGEDIFAKARALRAMRATTLDDPKGIAKIMDATGPDGINRAVSTEKIPDAVTGMSVDQLSHIVKTLKNVPQELQPQAQAALSEIKAQFANKAHDAGASLKGAWGATQVSKYLKANAERLKVVFADDPQALAKLGDLNDAGHILAIDQRYPGAIPQSENLIRSGLMKAPGWIGGGVGAAAGGLVGAPIVGAGIGQLIGGKISAAAGDAAALKAAKTRLVPLSSFPGLRP